ncbi:MAG: hypothetical protein ABSA97_13130 [Verrucomicrobiia bacterium]
MKTSRSVVEARCFDKLSMTMQRIRITSQGRVAQMVFAVVAALRAVAKALWRVGDCEARDVHFPKNFGASQKHRYTAKHEA